MKPCCSANYRIILLLILGSFLQTGCRVYKHYPLSYHGVQQLKNKPVQLYLVDNEHVLSEVWALKSYRFDKNEISCKIEHLPPLIARNVMLLSSREDAHESRNDVRLYAKPALVQQLKGADSVTFDYHLLDRVDVSELDVDQTILRTLGFLLLSGLVAFLVLILIAFTIFATF